MAMGEPKQSTPFKIAAEDGSHNQTFRPSVIAQTARNKVRAPSRVDVAGGGQGYAQLHGLMATPAVTCFKKPMSWRLLYLLVLKSVLRQKGGLTLVDQFGWVGAGLG